VQIYWTGFCAFHGNTKVTKNAYLDCPAGTHFFMDDPKLLCKFYIDEPKMYAKLIELGYSSRLCNRKILQKKLEGLADARILQKDWQSTKLKLVLAKKQYKDRKITQVVLDQKAADCQNAEHKFQLLANYLPVIKKLFREQQIIAIGLPLVPLAILVLRGYSKIGRGLKKRSLAAIFPRWSSRHTITASSSYEHQLAERVDPVTKSIST